MTMLEALILIINYRNIYDSHECTNYRYWLLLLEENNKVMRTIVIEYFSFGGQGKYL